MSENGTVEILVPAGPIKRAKRLVQLSKRDSRMPRFRDVDHLVEFAIAAFLRKQGVHI